MNYSLTLLLEIGGKMHSFPTDHTERLIQPLLRQYQSGSHLTIFRQGELIHYVYLRQTEYEGIRTGWCMTLNGDEILNLPILLLLFEDTWTTWMENIRWKYYEGFAQELLTMKNQQAILDLLRKKIDQATWKILPLDLLGGLQHEKYQHFLLNLHPRREDFKRFDLNSPLSAGKTTWHIKRKDDDLPKTLTPAPKRGLPLLRERLCRIDKRIVAGVAALILLLAIFYPLPFIRLAAGQGMAMAQRNLGNRYYKGNSVTQDYKQAVLWYQKAADQGDAVAQTKLGDCYFEGLGVDEDYKKAFSYYEKAAKQGYAEAQNNLGVLYDNGLGIFPDKEKAFDWYRKAAEQDHPTAQNNLGLCYYLGTGTTRDYEQAVYWFEKAAENEDADAQYNLGKCYYDGIGVGSNYALASEWLEKAQANGSAEAKELLNRIRKY